jgi:undecaprenyl-diphosphatase
MTLLQIVVLAFIQGLTEFLPVSSSAHLILGSQIFGWTDQGLVFDVATHLGTLLAVFIYFRRELLEMVRAWLAPVHTPEDRQHRAMGVYLVLASVPALLVGGVAHDVVEASLRDVRVIAWSTIGFGLLLWVSDAVGRTDRSLEQMSLGRAVAIGLAQALALVPGTSRSGVTITMGRFLGFAPEGGRRRGRLRCAARRGGRRGDRLAAIHARGRVRGAGRLALYRRISGTPEARRSAAFRRLPPAAGGDPALLGVILLWMAG